MSKPHKLSDYTEFLPKTERRATLPITNLPVNAISEETDPTFEIRTLIEQLGADFLEEREPARKALEKAGKAAEPIGSAEKRSQGAARTGARPELPVCQARRAQGAAGSRQQGASMSRCGQATRPACSAPASEYLR